MSDINSDFRYSMQKKILYLCTYRINMFLRIRNVKYIDKI